MKRTTKKYRNKVYKELQSKNRVTYLCVELKKISKLEHNFFTEFMLFKPKKTYPSLIFWPNSTEGDVFWKDMDKENPEHRERLRRVIVEFCIHMTNK